jgi:4-amino-4-deoxy-L-arabinose transferase-like glycosyltransferase
VKRTFVAVLILTAAAFALRLAYLLHSHPFIDEFTTVLAAVAILERGLPVLPSGLFYEHGLLFSYLDAPFVALAGEAGLFSVARLPSLLIGTATVPLLYWVGRRWLSPGAGLVAAALLAFSPEGIVWGGRARMYALAQLLVLILSFLV